MSGGNSPETRLNKVVLPAPLGPIRAWISPASTVRLVFGHGADAAELLGNIPDLDDGPLPRGRAQKVRQRQTLVDLALAHGRLLLGRRAEAAADGGPDADEAAGREQHEAHEHDAEPEQPVAGPDRQQLAEEDVEQHAERRTQDVVHAADHHHRQQLARERHRGGLGRDEVGLETEQGTADAGHHGRKHEHRQLVELDGIALERGTELVLADRHQNVPERRAHHAQQAKQNAQRDHRHERVVGEPIVQIDRAERAALETAQTVLAAGHLAPAEGDGVGQGRQRQRQKREVNPAPAQDERANDGRQHRDEGHRQQDRKNDLVVQPVLLGERGGIGADAEPGAVAEGGQARIAHEQVQTQGRNGENDHERRGADRQPEQAHGKGQRNERGRRDQQRAVLGVHAARAHSNFSMRSPSRPRGRSSSTRNIST